MKRRRFLWLLPLGVAGAGLALRRAGPPAAPQMPPPLVIDRAPAGAGAALLVDTGQTDAALPLPLRVTGRVAPWKTGGFRHQWPGIEVRARLDGDAVLIRLDDPDNRYRVEVGTDLTMTLTQPGQAVLSLTGLGPGPHDVRLRKLGESPRPAWFGGIFAVPPGQPLPAPPPRPLAITLYGDSDALGLGATSASRSCPGAATLLATDAFAAFPALLAERLEADLALIARSGLGLIRNYDGVDAAATLATLHARTLPDDPAPGTDPIPGLILTAIGANDFDTDLNPGEPWPDRAALRPAFAAALTGFVRDRLAEATGARAVLAAMSDYGPDLIAAHRDAHATLRGEGWPVALAILPEMSRRGCDWHMDAHDHILAADVIGKAIGSLR